MTQCPWPSVAAAVAAALARTLIAPLVVTILAAGACEPVQPTVPLDKPVFPTGIAVAGDQLLVVSSDFDLAFTDGALLSADLGALREKLASDDDGVIEDAYGPAALIPPFGDRPVLTSGNERVYVPTRGNNRVAVLDLAADGTFACGSTEKTPRCGESPFALQLSSADPFDVLITGEERDGDGALVRVDGLVTLLSAGEVTFFADDRSQDGAEQMQATGTLDLGVRGVRSLALRPEVAGSDPVVIAAADVGQSSKDARAVLVLFHPERDSAVASFDVTLATGARQLRDVVLVPGADGDADAVLVATRFPDAIARFEIDDGGDLPSLRLSALSSTCRGPLSFAFVRLAAVAAPAGTVDRVLLTCRDGDVVEAINPATLHATDVVRSFGRAPHDLAVDTSVTPPQVFVTFFDDGSVGVLELADDDGLPRLVARGRIGVPLPPPEDGRE